MRKQRSWYISIFLNCHKKLIYKHFIIIIIISINYFYMSNLVVIQPRRRGAFLILNFISPLRNQIQYFINTPHVWIQIAFLCCILNPSAYV